MEGWTPRQNIEVEFPYLAKYSRMASQWWVYLKSTLSRLSLGFQPLGRQTWFTTMCICRHVCVMCVILKCWRMPCERLTRLSVNISHLSQECQPPLVSPLGGIPIPAVQYRKWSDRQTVRNTTSRHFPLSHLLSDGADDVRGGWVNDSANSHCTIGGNVL